MRRWAFIIVLLLLLLVFLMAPKKLSNVTLPLGVRNNNPLNVKTPNGSAHYWHGQIALDAKGHAMFKELVDGARAGAINVLTQLIERGHNTLIALTNIYAPSSDTQANNDPSAYATFLGRELDMDVTDIVPNRKFGQLLLAMIEMEQGKSAETYFDVAVLKKGFAAGVRYKGYDPAKFGVLS